MVVWGWRSVVGEVVAVDEGVVLSELLLVSLVGEEDDDDDGLLVFGG